MVKKPSNVGILDQRARTRHGRNQAPRSFVGRCPLGVNRVGLALDRSLQVYPQDRTCCCAATTDVMCHFQTHALQQLPALFYHRIDAGKQHGWGRPSALHRPIGSARRDRRDPFHRPWPLGRGWRNRKPHRQIWPCHSLLDPGPCWGTSDLCGAKRNHASNYAPNWARRFHGHNLSYVTTSHDLNRTGIRPPAPAFRV
jgi:hypothetical protein